MDCCAQTTCQACMLARGRLLPDPPGSKSACPGTTIYADSTGQFWVFEQLNPNPRVGSCASLHSDKVLVEVAVVILKVANDSPMCAPHMNGTFFREGQLPSCVREFHRLYWTWGSSLLSLSFHAHPWPTIHSLLVRKGERASPKVCLRLRDSSHCLCHTKSEAERSRPEPMPVEDGQEVDLKHLGPAVLVVGQPLRIRDLAQIPNNEQLVRIRLPAHLHVRAVCVGAHPVLRPVVVFMDLGTGTPRSWHLNFNTKEKFSCHHSQNF